MTELLPRSMTLDEFTPLVGRMFSADTQPDPIAIKLVEAYASKGQANGERAPFILIFHTPPEAMLVEGAYALRCGDWGPDLVHMWPTNPPHGGEPGHYYQAVFN